VMPAFRIVARRRRRRRDALSSQDKDKAN